MEDITRTSEQQKPDTNISGEESEGSNKPSDETPKSSKKNLFIAALVSVMLVGGSVAVWVLNNQQPEQQIEEVAQTAKASTVVTLTKDMLFFRLGTKLIAHDPTLNVTQTLTEEIPLENSQIVDFYTNYQNEWRAYVTVYEGDSQKILLFNQDGKQNEAELRAGAFVNLASAEHTKYVYDILPDFEETEPKTTRTYLVTGDKEPQLIRESAESTGDKGQGELTNALYFSSAISKDGNTVLFQQANCYQCDGGYNARSFEFDLKTKESVLVVEDESLGNEYHYDKNGTLNLVDSNLGGIGDISQVDVSLFERADEASDFTQVASVKNADWRTIAANENYSFIAAEKAGETYSENSATEFAGLFRVGESIGEYEAVDIDLPTENKIISIIGDFPSQSENNCLGVLLSDRNFDFSEDSESESTLGYICVKSDGKLEYAEILKESFPSQLGDGFIDPAAVLL